MQTDATPWARWLNAAARFGLAPAAFWRLSAREWRALVAPADAGRLDRAGFAALAARFPDEMQ